MESLVPELVSAVQSASWQENPDVNHDLNPSTSSSLKAPVKLDHSANLADSNYDEIDGHDVDEEDVLNEGALDEQALEEGIEEDDIPYEVLRPVPRKTNLPPLPDMRFEQSYLKSIENADTQWKVAYITVRDQVFLPLLQGTVYSLVLLGWRHWNASASLSGQGWGSKARRWWYKTNNWSLDKLHKSPRQSTQFAKQVGDYYENQSSAGGD